MPGHDVGPHYSQCGLDEFGPVTNNGLERTAFIVVQLGALLLTVDTGVNRPPCQVASNLNIVPIGEPRGALLDPNSLASAKGPYLDDTLFQRLAQCAVFERTVDIVEGDDCRPAQHRADQALLEFLLVLGGRDDGAVVPGRNGTGQAGQITLPRTGDRRRHNVQWY